MMVRLPTISINQELTVDYDLISPVISNLLTGWNDQTKCSHCGGGLQDWLIADDPWQEHAWWFPYFVYLRYIKGPIFIRECKRLQPANEGWKRVLL